MVLAAVKRLGKWLSRPPKRWAHMQHVPWHHMLAMLLAVFLLFSVLGFFSDLMSGGREAYILTLANAIVGGLIAVAFFLAIARLPLYCFIILLVLQVNSNRLFRLLSRWIQNTFHPQHVAPERGIRFAAVSILICVLTSYICFVRYMRYTGRESFRLRNELALAHAIQKTLVPVLSRQLPAFEIYGISRPSEKVGGDLVDAVQLSDGDTVAYLADIAGHGLPAGILMGMLKTCARTALRDPSPSHGADTLALLMQRLDLVLPEVKEEHMYATFTSLRLNADGRAFYGMAASPPILHWNAADNTIARIEQEQFPLGLLPVPAFPAFALTIDPGDILLIATDGIIEVSSDKAPNRGTEFGVEALESLLRANARLPLAGLAASVLESIHAYGKQQDDQTLLLVRKTPRAL